jgi:hypothetical protein
MPYAVMKAQHPKSSATHKNAGRLLLLLAQNRHPNALCYVPFGVKQTSRHPRLRGFQSPFGVPDELEAQSPEVERKTRPRSRVTEQGKQDEAMEGITTPLRQAKMVSTLRAHVVA